MHIAYRARRLGSRLFGCLRFFKRVNKFYVDIFIRSCFIRSEKNTWRRTGLFREPWGRSMSRSGRLFDDMMNTINSQTSLNLYRTIGALVRLALGRQSIAKFSLLSSLQVKKKKKKRQVTTGEAIKKKEV